eukprot:scaffold61819_cov53-Phaeocystis_antarctica.AAC.4
MHIPCVRPACAVQASTPATGTAMAITYGYRPYYIRLQASTRATCTATATRPCTAPAGAASSGTPIWPRCCSRPKPKPKRSPSPKPDPNPNPNPTLTLASLILALTLVLAPTLSLTRCCLRPELSPSLSLSLSLALTLTRCCSGRAYLTTTLVLVLVLGLCTLYVTWLSPLLGTARGGRTSRPEGDRRQEADRDGAHLCSPLRTYAALRCPVQAAALCRLKPYAGCCPTQPCATRCATTRVRPSVCVTTLPPLPGAQQQGHDQAAQAVGGKGPPVLPAQGGADGVRAHEGCREAEEGAVNRRMYVWIAHYAACKV